MGLNLEPVKVSIEIETTSLAREAFYNICFITENEEAPRTLKVERLKDLLDNGYDRSSLAYNFCVGVFAQQGIPFVYVRAKRAVDSYADAFAADDNSNYYFVVIESKELYEISEFNEYLSSSDEYKLQFYSNNSKDLFEVRDGKLVNYYQEVFDFSGEEDYYLNKAYKVVTTHNYASKPYPALVEKQDGYSPEVELLDIELRTILKEYADYESFTPSVRPLDITQRELLQSKYIDGGVDDSYLPKVRFLDIKIREILKSSVFDEKESYKPSVRPLDMSIKETLVTQIAQDPAGFKVSIRPLDITINKKD